MIKCSDIEKKLIDLLEGSIPPDQQVACEEHIKRCRQCRELVATYHPLWNRLRDTTSLEPPDSLWRALQAQINRLEETQRSRSPLRTKWRPVVSLSLRSLGLAAAVVVGMLLGSTPTDTVALTDAEVIDYYAASLSQTSGSAMNSDIYDLGDSGQ